MGLIYLGRKTASPFERGFLIVEYNYLSDSSNFHYYFSNEYIYKTLTITETVDLVGYDSYFINGEG